MGGPQKQFFTEISVSVAPIKKKLKDLVHLFSNFDSGRTSQLVPNPFNWSPTHSTGPQKLYFSILIQGGPVNWSPTHSTGPQPIQLVPKNCFFTEISVLVAQIKKIKKLSPFIFE